jgi:hypothetical protein
MGIMGEDAFRDRVAALARECGEDGWAMPLPEHIRADWTPAWPIWPTSRASAGAACWWRARSCASSCRTASRGRTWTSRARASTPAARTGTRQGRHGRAGAHAGRGVAGHRRERLTPQLACAAPDGAGSAAGVVVAHRAAGSPPAARRRRDGEAVGELAHRVRAGHPAPGPLAVAATSSTVVSVTAVRGSTNASTPAWLRVHSRRYASSAECPPPRNRPTGSRPSNARGGHLLPRHRTPTGVVPSDKMTMA